jgi:hypothetical protein
LSAVARGGGKKYATASTSAAVSIEILASERERYRVSVCM